MEAFQEILEARRELIREQRFRDPEPDLFAKARDYAPLPRKSRELGWYPYFHPLERNLGPTAEMDGREVIMLGSNNYLGLSTHERVREASRTAVDRFGTSATGSRFLNGSLHIHEELEADLADFVGKEDALVFSTGYQTNLGTISALVDDGDVALVDREAHASILDGARLASGSMKTFLHDDPDSLRKRLARVPDEAGVLLVVDGVYSMGGDVASLPDLLEVLRERPGARILIDDAHGLGVMGPGGRGTPAHFGVTDEVDLIMGTFSKSLAGVGGYVAGSTDVIEYVRHHARSMIFSASLAPPVVAGVHEALRVLREDPGRVERLRRTVERVRTELTGAGFDTGRSASPVIPIICGNELRTITFWKRLLEEGIYVNPVIYPACPPDRSLLRTSYMATHAEAHVDRALETILRIGEELGIPDATS